MNSDASPNRTLPSSVCVTLETEQGGAQTTLETPDEVSYSFHCALEGGKYKVRVKYGEEIEEEVISVPLPRRFMNEHAPLNPLKVICTHPEKPWRLAIDRQKMVHFTSNFSTSFCTIGPNDKHPPPRVQCEDVKSARGIAVDTNEGRDTTVYITGDHKLQKYVGRTLKGEIGSFERSEMVNRFNDPNGVCFHKGKVYVCDSQNYRVQVFSPDMHGRNTEVIGRNTMSNPRDTVLRHPEDLDFDDQDDLYVVDKFRGVVVFRSVDDYESAFRRITLGDLLFPVSLRICRKANKSYFCVSDIDGYIAVFCTDGEFVRKVEILCNKTSKGCLQVLVDGGRKSISYLPPKSSVSNQARPVGLAVDGDGFLYVACYGCNEIHVLE